MLMLIIMHITNGITYFEWSTYLRSRHSKTHTFFFQNYKLIFVRVCIYIRQLRGEELEGLSLEELQQIEKKLEAGFSRVLEIKVSYYLS